MSHQTACTDPDHAGLGCKVTVYRAPREAYARGTAERDDIECSVGLELRDTDSDSRLSLYVLKLAQRALDRGYREHMVIVGFVVAELQRDFGDRAYFVETDQHGRGVQVYQPFGMPRNQ